jgi:hypothetical protein
MVSGFSQKTGVPACSAAADAGAWVWSGVATTTASIPLPIGPSNSRR